jgi:hypothetical protein
MPRGKRKTSVENGASEMHHSTSKKAKTSREYSNNNKNKKSGKTKNNNIAENPQCNVNSIISHRVRVDPDDSEIILETLVSWENFAENTWETMQILRYNLVFQEFVHDNFQKHETDIFVTIANFKERVKKKIRKYYSRYPKWYIMNNKVQPFDPFEVSSQITFYYEMLQ